ncbi:MAG: Sec-independent protein translocase subunit TatB [Paucibacter sp.]|nr:Sec-independent protein translocase subunit TatB [Roseateles sp.]
MLDFGIDKIALIGAVALVVLGPEKLPRVARTVGHLLGKAQRYVADVKAEVNRSIELEELKKMKTHVEDAARDVQNTVREQVDSANAAFGEIGKSWGGEADALGYGSVDPLPPMYKHPKKNWRLKRGATPQWYKQQNHVRRHAQSGAARVARFRPR